MKLRFLIVTLLIFIHFLTQAQITFSPIYRKFNKEVKARYYIDRIIDARVDTSTFVGTVIDTIARTVTEIEYEKSVPLATKESLDFAIDRDEKAIPIILKINHLEYGKRPIKKKGNIIGLYLDIELYMKKEDKFQKIGDLQKAFDGIKPSGSDNIDFSNLTWYVWKEILDDYIYKLKLKSIDDNLYNENDLAKSKILPPIFSTERLKDGIYLNYKEFLEANPAYYSKEMGECKLRFDGKVFYVTGSRDGKEQKIGSNFDLWAIVENGQVLHAFRSGNLARYEYVYLEPLGTTFEISGMGLKVYNKRLENYRKKNLKWNMILGGLSVNSLANYNIGTLLAIDMLRKISGSENSRYMINTSTGQLQSIPFINLSK
jgi:hypothetical protein